MVEFYCNKCKKLPILKHPEPLSCLSSVQENKKKYNKAALSFSKISDSLMDSYYLHPYIFFCVSQAQDESQIQMPSLKPSEIMERSQRKGGSFPHYAQLHFYSSLHLRMLEARVISVCMRVCG